MRLWGYDSHK